MEFVATRIIIMSVLLCTFCSCHFALFCLLFSIVFIFQFILPLIAFSGVGWLVYVVSLRSNLHQ